MNAVSGTLLQKRLQSLIFEGLEAISPVKNSKLHNQRMLASFGDSHQLSVTIKTSLDFEFRVRIKSCWLFERYEQHFLSIAYIF